MSSTSNKIVLSNVLGLLGLKVISMLISLGMIPSLLLYYKGDEFSLGLWLSFFSFVGVLTSLDFGMGNRLKNDILTRISAGENYIDLISNSIFTQFFIAVILLVTGGIYWVTVVFFSLDVSVFLNWTDSNINLILALGVYILLILPFRLTYFILQAKQKNALSALLVLIPQLGLYVFVITNEVNLNAKLLELSIVFFISSIVSYLVPFFFVVNLKETVESLLFSLVDIRIFITSQMKRINSGLNFFIIQLSIILIYGSNELFYIYTGSMEQVVYYQYYYRPFSIFFVGFSLVSLPFWSAIRLNHLDQNINRVRQLVMWVILLNVPIVILLIPVFFLYQDILVFWLGESAIDVSKQMLLLFSALVLLICLMHAFSSILSGYDMISIQAKTLASALILKIIFIFLLEKIDFFVDFVVVSTVASLCLVVSIFAFKSWQVWNFYLKENELVS